MALKRHWRGSAAGVRAPGGRNVRSAAGGSHRWMLVLPTLACGTQPSLQSVRDDHNNNPQAVTLASVHNDMSANSRTACCTQCNTHLHQPVHCHVLSHLLGRRCSRQGLSALELSANASRVCPLHLPSPKVLPESWAWKRTGCIGWKHADHRLD
jgi:hypothetical protein